MAVKRKSKKSDRLPIYDVVDERLALPPEHAHLCSMISDDDNIKPIAGTMRFVFNREVLERMQDIQDELEISRGLPVEAREVQIVDPVVVHILQKETQLTPQEALEKGIGWYLRQKRQAQSDAIFVALTMYNELNMVPTPYREGELAFSVEDTGQSRALPGWMKRTVDIQIPLPERNLRNPYESRLKMLFDLSQLCGYRWFLAFKTVVEEGVSRSIRLVAEARDEDGFQPEPPDPALSAQPGTADDNSRDLAG